MYKSDTTHTTAKTMNVDTTSAASRQGQRASVGRRCVGTSSSTVIDANEKSTSASAMGK